MWDRASRTHGDEGHRAPTTRRRWRLLTDLLVVVLILNIGFFSFLWQRTQTLQRNAAVQEEEIQAKATTGSLQGWVEEYVKDYSLPKNPGASDDDSLDAWVQGKVNAAVDDKMAAQEAPGEGTAPDAGATTPAGGTTTPPQTAPPSPAPNSVTNAMLQNDSVAGVTIIDGTITAADLADGAVSALSLVDGAVTGGKLAAGAVTLDKLGQNGCANGQTITWSINAWTCTTINAGSESYTAGPGLVLDSATKSFSLDTAYSNSWTGVQSFGNGLSIGNSGTLTNLAGSGLSLSGGTLSTTLGTSIDANELADGAVTAAKLAAGAITLDSLNQSGCSISQTIKWSGTAWACGADIDTNTTYTAGNGLALSGNTLTLDPAANIVWTGAHEFNGGFMLNGTTYSSLTGTGLQLSSNSLSTTLGTSIEGAELQAGSVTNSKIADRTISLSKLGQNGCAIDQVIKWNGTDWVCADSDSSAPPTTPSSPTYTAGAGLLLDGSSFRLDADSANTWAAMQTFDGGVTIGGNTVSTLDGSGLQLSGGTLSARLGTSIGTSELEDNAVTADKLAPGIITLDKLSQNNCAASQTIKWNGTTWICADDSDTSMVYTAGSGLALNAGAFSIDTAQNLTWTGTQSFNGGVAIGGATYTALTGSGLAYSSGTLSATLGTSIETAEITDNAITSAKLADGSVATADLADGSITADKLAPGSVTLSKLGSNGCTSGQIMQWNGSAWVCASDADTNTTYTAGNGLTLANGAFALDLSRAQAWSGLQTFSGGLAVGGNTYTSLTGSGLTYSNGSLAATLGTSIETAEVSDGAITGAKIANGAVATADLADGAVTSDKLAAGVITLDKIGSNGCTNGQILKWNGSAWACAADIDTDTDTNTVYTAGGGLSLSGTAFALNTAYAATWTGLQSFDGGLSIGGTTYTNLAGAGLTMSGGSLTSTLGVSIESGEITDGAITLAKLGQNGCTNGQIIKRGSSAWSCSDTTVTANELADSSVTSAKILDGTVISADLADGAVTSAKILDGTITGMDIASGTITANNIADGAITSSKLSTSARKRVVTANIPSIAVALLSVQEQAIFVAPTSGTITKVTFTSGNNVISVSTGGSISVERRTPTAATVASVSLASTSLMGMTPTAPTLNAGLNFNAGDVYTFKYAPGLVGLALNNMLVTIEYVAAE